MIRVVCCYCKKQVKTKPSDFDDDLPRRLRPVPPPHGPGARAAHVGVPRRAEPPVLVVQDNARVIAANAAARKMLTREQLEICGELAGEVLGCSHAREPGGCGQTVHCKSCAIRQCVAHTMETAEPCRKTAFADIGLVSGDKRLRFLIETEKVNSFVRLTMYDVREE